jgi:hypothetical protein
MVPPDAIAETAPKRPYAEIEGDDPARIYLHCQCGQVIKKRRDSFIPNMHVVICLACNNFSTTVQEIEQPALVKSA